MGGTSIQIRQQQNNPPLNLVVRTAAGLDPFDGSSALSRFGNLCSELPYDSGREGMPHS